MCVRIKYGILYFIYGHLDVFDDKAKVHRLFISPTFSTCFAFSPRMGVQRPLLLCIDNAHHEGFASICIPSEVQAVHLPTLYWKRAFG